MLRIKRDQLTPFIENQDTIKAFETLFRLAVKFPEWVNIDPAFIYPGNTAETAYSGNFIAPEFSEGATQQFKYILNHGYQEGTNIVPTVQIYIPAGTGKISFDMEYHWSNKNDDGAILSKTISLEIEKTENEIIQNFYGEFPMILGSQKKIDSVFSAILTRTANTFTGSVWLLGCPIQVKYNTVGSQESDGK